MPIIGEIKRASEIGKKSNPSSKFIWHACIDCGVERWVAVVGDKPRKLLCKRCCHRCERSGKWTGGNSHNTQGYKTVMLHPSDFYYPMVDNKNYVLEHRLIVAKSLGRCLHSWEIVHHKNHDKTDNRLDNLSLEMVNNHQQLTILENKLRKLQEDNRRLKEELRCEKHA